MSMSIEDKRRAVLELQLRRRQAAEAEERDRVVAVSRDDRLPCSHQQEGLWLLHQIDPDLSVYEIPLAVRLRGRLDLGALVAALTALVARHESLRSRFESLHGVPEQVIDPVPQAWPMPVIELPRAEVPGWIRAQQHVPFDLRTGPLFRSSLARVEPDEHVLMLVMHHIVTDGWSVTVLSRELSELYNAALAGTTPALAKLEVQAADHAAWQRRWLTGSQLQRELGYWREALEDLQTLEFPADRPRPAQPTGAGAMFERRLPDELAAALRGLARHEQASFLAVLLAGFLAVLSRYTGQDDLAVGSVFSGRTRTEIEPLVGFFANTSVLRTSIAGDPTGRELIRRCNDTVLGATAHQDVPFGLVVDTLKPDRVPGLNPLFQVSLTVQAAGVTGGGLHFAGLEATELDTNSDRARFDLAVAAVERTDDGLDLTMEYSTELFDTDRIERLADHFVIALAEIAADPGARIGELEIMAEPERISVLDRWNPAPVPRPLGGCLLHELVAGRVAQAPHRVAMRFAGQDLTYGELDRRSSQLANLLASTGSTTGTVTGVLLERGFDLPVAELAILKAGGAWLPMDPQNPPDRLAYQIADARVTRVITTTDLAGLLPASTTSILLDSDVLQGQPETTTRDVKIHQEDTAYVIYTSGSTGRPKGVVVPHRAAVHFCINLGELFRMSPSDRVLQLANPAFDVSVSDFFATFAAGATVIGAPRPVLLNPDTLQELMRDERVTFGDIPPVMLRSLDPEPLVNLRALFIGMEPFGPELVNRWARPGREFHNGYGPTEATITCVDYPCPAEPLDGPPPIGRAMANHRAYVLDRRQRLTPIGVPGELYLTGAGLAHGYLGRPGLTAEKFVPDPFAAEPGTRMYATGDLVRWRSDGNLEFLGRVDRQVKIRGLRIELGEIEHMLASQAGVRQATVVVKEPGTPQARLVGYVVTEPGHDVDPDQVRDRLADRLPLAMVPGVILTLPELPLTGNGKIDQARLPDPSGPADASYVAPGTDTQRRLAGIWSDLLGSGAGRIGIHDSFFDLGGNSLQVTQLMARITERFGVTLHPRELFASPSLGQLAARVDEGDRQPGGRSVSVLVPIKPDGTRPPLFLVHAVGGSVLPYVALASLLPADQPCYGLEHAGLHGDRPDGRPEDTATQRIPQIAASYLSAIRQVQPAGPYHLGGWSFGGTVAVEMASQLRAAGEEVALVVMLDTGVPITGGPNTGGLITGAEPDQAELLAWFTADFAGIAGSDPPAMDLAALRQLPAGQQVDATLAALESAGLTSAELRAELRNRIRVFLGNSRAYLAYQPAPYDGRLVLLRAADEPDEDAERWRVLAPESFEHYVVPGNHYTMIAPPHLSAVAQAVQRCLRDPVTLRTARR
jgi:amino acid adenylation domain-containing protein